MLVLGISGSQFTDPTVHNAAKALHTALMAAKDAGAQVDTINLPMDFPHCDGRREEETFDLHGRIDRLPHYGRLKQTVRAILAADAVIFAGPTHNFSADSRTLALMSWLQVTVDAPEYPLAGKVAAFMSVCEEDGGQNANEKKFSPANHLGFIVPPFCSYFYNKFASESEGNWQETDRRLVGLNVVRMLKILRGELRNLTAEEWNDSESSS